MKDAFKIISDGTYMGTQIVDPETGVKLAIPVTEVHISIVPPPRRVKMTGAPLSNVKPPQHMLNGYTATVVLADSMFEGPGYLNERQAADLKAWMDRTKFHVPLSDEIAREDLLIYLAGPMSGIKDKNYPLFNFKADELRELGFMVANPAELKSNKEEPQWIDFMRLTIPQLMSCNAVALLPGWENSRGAVIEKKLADSFGFLVQDVDKWLTTPY